MKHMYILALAVLMTAAIAFAQEEAPKPAAPAPAAAGEKAAAQPAPPGPPGPPAAPKEQAPAPAPEPSKGDTVTLKNGSVLKSVQVVRRSPSSLEVQVSDGVVLTVPRKQIENVEYDDVEPLQAARAKANAPEKAGSDLIPGDKIQPELSEKLAAAVDEPALNFKDEDVLKVLGELAKRFSVTIEVDQAVKDMPAEKRVVTLEVKPGSNLTTVLQQDLFGKLQELAVEYRFDHLFVKQKGAETTPAADAAAAPAEEAAKPAPEKEDAPAAQAAPPAAPEQ